MRTSRGLIAAAPLALAVGIAMPASADVEIDAQIHKDKDIHVEVVLKKDIDVVLKVEAEFHPIKAAEAMPISNQRAEDNEYRIAHPTEDGVYNDASTDGAMSGNSGITALNSAAGDGNQQANVTSASLTNPDGVVGFASSGSAAEQRLTNNTVTGDGWSGSNTAALENSVTGNNGLAAANNAAGNSNLQSNTQSIAVAIADAGLAVSEADLGQWTINNEVLYAGYLGQSNTASLSGSVSGNTGITSVNNAAGNFNSQANVVSIAALAPPRSVDF